MTGDHPGVPGLGDAPFNAGGRRATRIDDQHEAVEDDDALDRSLILASVARDARLDRKFLLLIILAAMIATLGLLQSSTAVVIGAMLVSPLMGPIMGVGFGLATLESNLIRRSLVTLAAGMAVAILVAMLIIWLSPIRDVTPELRARTQPTLLDLGVAVVGGIAGVYAIMRKLSGVMVGVAIATALVPPLSTVGFGLATGRFDFAVGAALLFLTNTLAIAFAATIVARLNHFGPSLTPQHTAMQVAGIVATLGILSIPLALTLNSLAGEVRARSVVQTELRSLLGESDRVDSLNVRLERDAIAIDGVVLVDRYAGQLDKKLAARIGAELDREVRVNIVQLRQQTNAAVQVEEQLNRRLAALEQREEDSRAILTGLTVGELLPRDRVLIDAQARRVVVQRDREAEGEQVAAAIDRIVASVQADYPQWLIQNGSFTAAETPAAETAAAE
ncbi:MAG: TIGR00341 family protein [Sphingopyxis sp.]|uniref:TIGR00341 family protein n=1 Tax=Sphingopyxis sp. TaxID=1908224 RepID=UPI001A239E78|nr:TIGR00341 family protein [Sphingopyxis sp.]MBJ7501946.1 TIGR00341 family protein [Sphingopyxis sp.]